MTSVFELPIPEDHQAGVSFAISKVPLSDQLLHWTDARAEIRQGSHGLTCSS
jgi:hypothetical protein